MKIFLIIMYGLGIVSLIDFSINGFDKNLVYCFLSIVVVTIAFAIIFDRVDKKRRNYTPKEVTDIDCENALYLKQEISKYENIFSKMEMILYKSFLKRISKGKNVDFSFIDFIDGLDKYKSNENFEINNFVNKLQKILKDNMA